MGLRNSSNFVEKENALFVVKRQKHDGMSWTAMETVPWPR